MASSSRTLQDFMNDLVRFLAETLVDEPLSSRAEMERATLLQRLVPHIRQGGVSFTSLPIMIMQNMEMNGENDSNLEGDYVEPLKAIPSQASSSSNSGEYEDNFKINICFRELRNMTHKCGPLWRREKVIFLDQWRKYWSGLYGHFLLMYSSEHDVKPCVSVNIQNYVVRPASKCNKKKDATFEMVCPGKRDYQFFARTVKDMHQWIAAIYQAGIQHIQTFDSCSSTLYSEKSGPATADDDNETYDDAGFIMKCNGKSGNIHEVQQSEEEEIYHNILDVHKGHSKLKSKPAEKCPPLPPRQPLPAIPQDDLFDAGVSYKCNVYTNMTDASVGGRGAEVQPDAGVYKGDSRLESQPVEKFPPLPQRPLPYILQDNLSEQDAEYDDVRVSYQYNEYANMTHTGIGGRGTEVQPHNSVKPEVQYDEATEEIYDDIEVTKEVSKAIKPPLLEGKTSVGNRSGIQDRIKQLKAVHPNRAIPIGGHHTIPKISNQIQENFSTLYKPMKTNGKDTVSSLSQIPAANHNPKSKLHNQVQPNTTNLYKPRTALGLKPPKLPPRSYLK